MEAHRARRVKSKEKNRKTRQHDTKNILRYDALHDIINLIEFKDGKQPLEQKR